MPSHCTAEEREEREQQNNVKPGGEESTESVEVSQGEQVLQVQPEKERAREEEEEEEEEGEREKTEVEEQAAEEVRTGRETEVDVAGIDKEGSREESNVAMSQEELRKRRLKHLDQWVILAPTLWVILHRLFFLCTHVLEAVILMPFAIILTMEVEL